MVTEVGLRSLWLTALPLPSVLTIWVQTTGQEYLQLTQLQYFGHQRLEDDVPELVAAVAACIAAVLSGATLVIAGRRDERRWRREAMTDTLVTFLEGSFAGGQRLYDARLRNEDTTEYRELAVKAHLQQVDALTKLRLLAPSNVVAAAEELHRAGHAVRSVALNQPDLPSVDAWNELRQTQVQARDQLLTAARRALGLGPAQTIGALPLITTIAAPAQPPKP